QRRTWPRRKAPRAERKGGGEGGRSVRSALGFGIPAFPPFPRLGNCEGATIRLTRSVPRGREGSSSQSTFQPGGPMNRLFVAILAALVALPLVTVTPRAWAAAETRKTLVKGPKPMHVSKGAPVTLT